MYTPIVHTILGNIWLQLQHIWQDNQLSCLHKLFLPLFSEHSTKMDVDVSNKKYLARTEEFWDTIQASGWWQFDEESEKQKQTNGE